MAQPYQQPHWQWENFPNHSYPQPIPESTHAYTWDAYNDTSLDWFEGSAEQQNSHLQQTGYTWSDPDADDLTMQYANLHDLQGALSSYQINSQASTPMSQHSRHPHTRLLNVHAPERHQSATSRRSSHTSSSVSTEETFSKRCYEHGCRGREFSCAENYRRHMRERSGKGNTTCPHCSAAFTRKSNRDTHVAKGRCKALGRVSEHDASSPDDGIADDRSDSANDFGSPPLRQKSHPRSQAARRG